MVVRKKVVPSGFAAPIGSDEFVLLVPGLDDPDRGATYGRNGQRYAADQLSEQAAHRRITEFVRNLCEPMRNPVRNP